MADRPASRFTLSRLLDEGPELAPEAKAWVESLPLRQGPLRDEPAPARETWAAQLRDDTLANSGDLVGAYRLLREIASGGMGSVWVAERVDGTLNRQVALKLPHLAWGAGLAERMARERDISARLEHPHIARLYDAGSTSAADPFSPSSTSTACPSMPGARSKRCPRVRACGCSCRWRRRWRMRTRGSSCTATSSRPTCS
jgi:hypothetical protein